MYSTATHRVSCYMRMYAYMGVMWCDYDHMMKLLTHARSMCMLMVTVDNNVVTALDKRVKDRWGNR